MLLFCVSMSISGSGLEASTIAYSGNTGGNEKTQETHYYVVLLSLRCLDNLLSFHLKGPSCAFSFFYLQDFFVRLKGDNHSILARTRSPLIMCFSFIKSNTNVRKCCQD